MPLVQPGSYVYDHACFLMMRLSESFCQNSRKRVQKFLSKVVFLKLSHPIVFNLNVQCKSAEISLDALHILASQMS